MTSGLDRSANAGMSRAARTVFVFGIYLIALGLSLLVVPNAVLAVLGVARTHQVWIRILGTVLTYVGAYYVVAARHEMTAIFRASIAVRLSLILVLLGLVLFADAKPVVMVFGVADAAGALWTRAALAGRRSGVPTGPSTLARP